MNTIDSIPTKHIMINTHFCRDKDFSIREECCPGLNMQYDGVEDYWSTYEVNKDISIYNDPRLDARDYLEKLTVSFRVSSSQSWLVKDLYELCESARRFVLDYPDPEKMEEIYDKYDEVSIDITDNIFESRMSGNYEGTVIRITMSTDLPPKTVKEAALRFFTDEVPIKLGLEWDISKRNVLVHAELLNRICIFGKFYKYDLVILNNNTNQPIQSISELVSANGNIDVVFKINLDDNDYVFQLYRMRTGWPIYDSDTKYGCAYTVLDKVD